ncbi:MAG TPA: Holliday junction resolvase RuvX [Bacteroidales bacterium]|nr:Holliday junction resolvase RuvX [Bacteroidales bacterium]HPF03367.1 Holliday junction resolvase RuvX [Bacteroidales bacterium]HPJ60352.1 Holliday junction resolvase RuvX [Bacteroidales bacterium]HPR13128.1 Holliday junction resolvase RuvX [Bacteroidales bacterium]HRW85064.1 Holliday junction resolvase RuvX [Bacteroidales bacterium]
MARILGIDYGKKRVGVAVSDPLQIFASPLKTVNVQEFEAFLNDYLLTEQVEAFVIGYPVRLNNQPSESVKYIDPFIARLRKKFPQQQLHLVDERFTTSIAKQSMIDGGMKKKDRQNRFIADMISASIILQSFLDNRTMKKDKIH